MRVEFDDNVIAPDQADVAARIERVITGVAREVSGQTGDTSGSRALVLSRRLLKRLHVLMSPIEPRGFPSKPMVTITIVSGSWGNAITLLSNAFRLGAQSSKASND